MIDKFGRAYDVNQETFTMGVNHLFADHIASKFKGCKVVLDTCCGAGFIAIALANCVDKVITVDINPEHLAQAKNNANIAGVSDKIVFIHGDIISNKIISSISFFDGAFLDPDWARAGDDKTIHTSRLSEMQPPADVLLELIRSRIENIALRLPKEIDTGELEKYKNYKIERFLMNGKIKFFTIYFGKLLESTKTDLFEIT